VWKPILTVVMLGVMAAAFLGMLGRSVSFSTGQYESIEAALACNLATLRQRIADFRTDHGFWPDGSVVEQLEHATDAQGRVVEHGAFGPYLRVAFPENPLNHEATVRCVDALPAAPDGMTGWYYVVPTGEVRANATGVGLDGSAWFQR
jgi:hypothetical protein